MARQIKSFTRHVRGIEDEEDPLIINEEEEAEGILLPDYYHPEALVPEIPWRTIWANDEGEVEMPDETLRLAPRGMFVQPPSELSKRIDANIKQMQETRKVCSKITVIKQMQVQTQVCMITSSLAQSLVTNNYHRCTQTNSPNTIPKNS
jgi:transcriptional activator SPT7